MSFLIILNAYEQADLLLQHTHSQAMLGLHEYTSQLKESYEVLLDKPALLQSDYIFEIYQKRINSSFNYLML